MPDGFALAALSYALRTRIQQSIDDAVDAAQVGAFDIVTRAPEQLSANNPTRVTINVYPWRLVSNPGWASSRGAGYGPSGERRASQLLALDVYYILGGYAPTSQDADAALGWALLALHETPQISRDLLQALAAAIDSPASPLPQALRDLAEQPAPITVEPIWNELEALSQVWSTLNSGARTGSVYRVGTLLMESRRRAASAPPVREGRLSVTQLRAPHIARLQVAASAGERFELRSTAAPGEVLRLEGSGLTGEVTHVAFGAVLVEAEPNRSRPERIEIDVPDDLRPGVTTLQVRQQWPKPAGKKPPPALGTILGERSNLLPLAIRPVLEDDAFGIEAGVDAGDGSPSFDVTARFAVPVGNRQRVELLLNAVAPGPGGQLGSFAFSAPAPAADAADATVTTRVVPISGVPAGNYFARVVVDGAESALREAELGFVGPILVVPA